jgi:hypothetical protein
MSMGFVVDGRACSPVWFGVVVLYQYRLKEWRASQKQIDGGSRWNVEDLLHERLDLRPTQRICISRVTREDLVKPGAKGRIERKIKGPFQEGTMGEGTPLNEGWSNLSDYEGYER